VRSEAARTIGRGYFFLVIGVLWYLVQEGLVDFGRAFALFLVFVGVYLIFRGILEARNREKEKNGGGAGEKGSS